MMGLGKIVIFGGGGFIGSRFLDVYRSETSAAWVIDRFYGPSHPDLSHYHHHLEQRRGSQDVVLSIEAHQTENFSEVLSDADVVFILNADTGTAQSFAQPAHTVGENALNLARITESIIQRCEPDKCNIVFTSSRAVYGEGYWICKEHGYQTLDRSFDALSDQLFQQGCSICSQPLQLHSTPEEAPLVPLSVYGLTKKFGEEFLRLTLVNKGFNVRIARFQNVFGPGQEVTNPYTGVLNWFASALMQNKPVEIYENGNIIRDFIYIDDAVRHLFALAKQPLISNPASVEVFNGGTGVPVSLGYVAGTLKEMLNSRSEIDISPKFRIGDVLGAVADMSRTADVLGFESSLSLEEGLKRYADWFVKQ